jgi:hypothetical protein
MRRELSAMRHRETLRTMGITIEIDPDCETFAVDVTPKAPVLDLADLEVEVTQEDIDNATSRSDAIRRGIERALMQRLLV